MVLTHIGTVKYHKVSEVYHKVSKALNAFMDGSGKKIESTCKYLQSIMVLIYKENEKYHIISEAYHKLN